MERTAEDDALLGAVRMAMAVSVHAADQIGNVSAVQLRALTVLREQPGANLALLAQAMNVTMSTASRLVDRLVAADLVDRRPSPMTRREVTLTLTEVGVRTLERYDQVRLDQLRDSLARVSPSQQDVVVASLARLVDAWHAGPESPPESAGGEDSAAAGPVRELAGDPQPDR